MRRLPDFLIVGAMKSGTTVLYDFICEHEAVNRAKEKEIHYFSLYPYRGMDWYLDHFKPEEGKIFGEASPTYFNVAYTPAIPHTLKSMMPDVKIILIVRDPVERAISHFFHYQKVNKLDLLADYTVDKFFARPFEEALKRTTAVDVYLHDALSFSCYFRNFLGYKNVFPKKQILVLHMRELRLIPQQVMNRVFDFLELPTIQSEEFSRFKYSTGSSLSAANSETLAKLKRFLYPDYQRFCDIAGIEFNGE